MENYTDSLTPTEQCMRIAAARCVVWIYSAIFSFSVFIIKCKKENDCQKWIAARSVDFKVYAIFHCFTCMLT